MRGTGSVTQVCVGFAMCMYIVHEGEGGGGEEGREGGYILPC